MIPDRRSSVRIDDYLAFSYKVIPESQYKAELDLFPKTQSGVEQIETKYPFFSCLQDKYNDIEGDITVSDQVVLDLLVNINDKLDSIIQMLGAGQEPNRFNLCLKKPSFVNISGGGLRFLSDKEIKKGSFLKIQICIPAFPSFVISTLAEVIWTEIQSPDRYLIATQFTAIHEDDRDALIHYIFIKQRKSIRKTKGR